MSPELMPKPPQRTILKANGNGKFSCRKIGNRPLSRRKAGRVSPAPAAREQRTESKGSLSENRELLKKDIYISKVKRRLPAWLLPLLLTLFMLLCLFWLLPLLFHSGEVAEPQPSVVSPENLVVEDSAIRRGDLLYIRAGEAAVYQTAERSAPRLCSALCGERAEAMNGAMEGRVRVRLEDGVEGWVEAADLAFPGGKEERAIRKQGLVLAPVKRVMSHAISGHLLFEAPMGSRLDVDYVSRDVLRLRLGDGSMAWISPDGVKLLDPGAAIPQPADAARLFASSAMNFYGARVVPGGCSRNGADMAGVLYISALVNGLSLPRDLAGQAALGEAVETIRDPSTNLVRISLLQTGDVLFFHDGFDQKKAVFAALLLENGQALCRLTNDSTLEIRELEREPEILRRLMSVRRYFPSADSEQP